MTIHIELIYYTLLTNHIFTKLEIYLDIGLDNCSFRNVVIV